MLTTKALFASGLILVSGATMSAADPVKAEKSGEGLRVQSMERMKFRVWRGSQRLCDFDLRVWGPAWTWAEFTAMPTVKENRRVFDERMDFAKKGSMTIHCEVQQTAPDTVTLRGTCESGTDLKITGLTLIVPSGESLPGSTAEATAENGGKKTFTLPPERFKFAGAKSIVLTIPGEKPIAVIPGKNCDVAPDTGDLRIWLNGSDPALTANQPMEFSVALKFGEPVTFDPHNRVIDMKNWFRLAGVTDAGQGVNDVSPGSVIGMEDWLDKPAGKHGAPGFKGDRFVFADGTPVKFWATNISFSMMCQPPELVDRWADKFAKHGFNLVRFHKWIGMGWAGIMVDKDRWTLDEVKIKQFDYFHAALAKRGIYSGWSPIAFLALCPGDRDKMVAYDEIVAAAADRTNFLKNTGYQFVNFAPDIQDIYIRQITDMLKRVNSATGKRYADDPSLAYVEMQNEDDAFFFGIGDLLKKCPTYHKQLSDKLAAWLLKHYGSEEALRKAWEMKEGETIAAATVNPIAGWIAPNSPVPRRTLDRYHFMHDQQFEFYRRFEKAIRETGYKGALIGSNWQAATWLGHFYNLATDRAIGFIDRHNYARDVMIRNPGSAPLSAGMQQVADRPFGLSEWGAIGLMQYDCVPIIAAYGMGLQGWDYSAQFSGSSPWIRGDLRGGLNEICDTLPNIAQYPSLARMIYRGDVKEGEIVSTRNVSMQELEDGKIGFEEKLANSGGNFQAFSGSVPVAALAVGRVVINFTDQPASKGLDQERLVALMDPSARVFRSVTGQLTWDTTNEGHITINTPGTQAVIGHASGRTLTFADTTILTGNPQVNIFISALDKDATIDKARRLLVTTLGRTFDEGTVIDENGSKAASVPELKYPSFSSKERRIDEQRAEFSAKNPTLLIEPVKAEITLKRSGPCRVIPLDHAGRMLPKAEPIPVTTADDSVRFTVDGDQSKTFYYLVEFTK